MKKFWQILHKMPQPVWQLLISAFFAGMGLRLNWLFLNFYLEDIGFSRDMIGYANAVPAIAMVTLGIPASLLAPRIGYVVSLRWAGALAALGLIAVAITPITSVIFAGLFVFGLGNSLIMATTPPILQRLAPTDMRVTAFAWYGALGTTAGFLGSVIGGYLPTWLGSLQRVVFLMAFIFAASIVPLIRLPRRSTNEPRQFRLRQPTLWAKLILPNTIIAFGAGLVMPFLNLYLADKFGLSYEFIGLLFGISALATTVTILIQPWLVDMWGKVGAVIASQTAALPFILVLAYVPFLPLVTLAMFVREALMNAANPIYTALGMQLLADEESAAYMIAIGALWRVAWAISSSVSGQLQENLGLIAFNYLFAAMFSLYAISILLLAFFFWRQRWQLEQVAVPTLTAD